VRVLSATDLVAHRGEALLDLSAVQVAAGLRAAAEVSAADARTLFERKGHLVGTERAAQMMMRPADIEPGS
jgi:hypothetical protein